MTAFERECNAEDDARREAELREELRKIQTWDRGPHPMPIRLHERREQIKAALGL